LPVLVWNCFKLDIQFKSQVRHADAVAAITDYLKLGNYHDWDESQRQRFLLNELNNPRPLLPRQLHATADAPINAELVKEVLATFNMLAQQPAGALGAYVISMAKQPSDVLAVMLLRKEAEVPHPMRVCTVI